MKGNSQRRSRAAASHHTLVGNAFRETGHKIDEFGEMAAKKTDNLLHRGVEVAGNMREGVGTYGNKVVGFIKEHPVQSMLIAGAVGLVFGKLFIGNNKREEK